MNKPSILAAALLASSAVTLHSDVAEACGGLFCDGGQNTVNQAAERIVFADHPDGSVTAVVQIMYDGPADRFGWLLPVPGIPEVGLSSDAAFQRLQNATNPQYSLNRRVEGECAREEFLNNGTAENDGFANNADAGASGNNASTNNGVTVLAEGNTGPYDYVVIQVDNEDNKTQIALDWLADNNYEVGNVGPDLLTDYLDDGFNLLAIRLQKQDDAGTVRPIRLTYDSSHPMIPIKLTAVAANQDMGVMTWVLGPDRAIPLNYKSLTLNDALLNWFNPTSNYNDVITAAANEASGQGFVTEYADDTSTLGAVVWRADEESDWTFYKGRDWTTEPLNDLFWYSFIALSTFDPFTGMQQPFDGIDQVIDTALPNLTADERQRLMQCPDCFPDDAAFPADFDPQVWLDAMEEFVVGPMRDTQELFDDLPYVTRLYTTMSANEMTVDPSFSFKSTLGDVSNTNTADYIIECSPTYYQWEAPFRVELPSGLVVRGANQGQWPVQPSMMMPYTLLVAQESPDADAEVVRDNYDTVKEQLEEQNARVPKGSGSGMASGGDVDGDGDVDFDDDLNGDGIVDEKDEELAMDGRPVEGGGGCSVASGSAALSVTGLLGFIGVGRLRRRRD